MSVYIVNNKVVAIIANNYAVAQTSDNSLDFRVLSTKMHTFWNRFCFY